MVLGLKYDAPTTEVDLTSTDTNEMAAPQATPRLGGFTLRNRFSGALANTMSGSCVSSSDVDVNQITILDIPKRTLVTGLNLFAVESETVPGHALAYSGTSASLTASDQTMNLGFIAQPYKDPSQSTLDSVSTNLTIGTLLLTAATGSLVKGSITGSPVVAVDSNTSSATKGGIAIASSIGSSNAYDAGAFNTPRYFPHGGKILMALTGSVADSATDVNRMSGVCSGVWEVQATCKYVPE